MVSLVPGTFRGRTALASPLLISASRVLQRALTEAEGFEVDLSILDALLVSDACQNASGAERRLALRYLHSEIEPLYGGADSALSTWHGQTGKSFPGPDLLLSIGLGRLVAHMGRGLDIRLQQQVASVAPVEVWLLDGERITADRILCTVPLGVLKAGRITFKVPLDPAIQAEIDGLGMGVVNKLWLRFDRVAWPVDLDWFTSASRGLWAAWASFAGMDGLSDWKSPRC